VRGPEHLAQGTVEVRLFIIIDGRRGKRSSEGEPDDYYCNPPSRCLEIVSCTEDAIEPNPNLKRQGFQHEICRRS
jgi:hypothetical protein